MGSKPLYVPTPAEIRAACEEIRAGWTEAEAAYRKSHMPQRGGAIRAVVEAMALRPQCYHLGTSRGKPIVEPAAFPPSMPDGGGRGK